MSISTRHWRRGGRFAIVAGLVGAAVAVGFGVAALLPSRQPLAADASRSPAPSLTSHAPSAAITPQATPSPTVLPSSSSPTSAATPAATPRPSGSATLEWVKTAHVDGLVSRPVALDDVWLVVGSSDGRAATWSSLDAGSWVPAEPIDPPPFDELDSGGSSAEWWLNTVVAYAGTQIGLGWEHVGAGDGSQIAIWKSRDGLTWTNVPTRGSTIDTYEIPTDAVVAPDGSLVVATAGGLGSSSSIWMTRDGATWEGHSFSQAGSQSRIDGLAASNQLILAVGTGEGVWSSVDGSTWTTLELPAGAEWLTDVAYDPSKGRFVVVGRRVDARAGVWFTVDGRSWQSTTLSDGPGATWSVEIGGSVTAIGGDLGAEGESAATVWSSHDGVTWRSVTLRERARVEGIDVGGDGTTVLAVQRYEDEFEGGVEVWTGRLVNSP